MEVGRPAEYKTGSTNITTHTCMGYDVIMRARFAMVTSGVFPPRVPLLLRIVDGLGRYRKSFVVFEIFSQSPRLSMFLAGLEDT